MLHTIGDFERLGDYKPFTVWYKTADAYEINDVETEKRAEPIFEQRENYEGLAIMLFIKNLAGNIQYKSVRKADISPESPNFAEAHKKFGITKHGY